MAPVAASQKAVIQDPASLRVAEAIHDAFGDLCSEQGLTRAELAAACSSVASPEEFDGRFNVLVGLHLLERARGKAHDGLLIGLLTSEPICSEVMTSRSAVGPGGPDALPSMVSGTDSRVSG